MKSGPFVLMYLHKLTSHPFLRQFKASTNSRVLRTEGITKGRKKGNETSGGCIIKSILHGNVYNLLPFQNQQHMEIICTSSQMQRISVPKT